MIVESISIILIILVASFMFARAKKVKYGIATIPLISVPVFHIIASLITPLLSNDINTTAIAITLADIAALVISALLLGLFSNVFSSKSTKTSYLVLSGLFVFILTSVFVCSNTNMLSYPH